MITPFQAFKSNVQSTPKDYRYVNESGFNYFESKTNEWCLRNSNNRKDYVLRSPDRGQIPLSWSERQEAHRLIKWWARFMLV